MRVRALPPTPGPRRSGRIEIELERSTDAARLIFVTRGGRRAERRLAHPDELMPTVVALGVRGASEMSTPVLEDGPMAPARATDAVSPLDSPPRSPPRRRARHERSLRRSVEPVLARGAS